MGDHWADMAELVALGDRDLAGDDQGEALAGLADLDQGLARGEGARLAETAQPVELLRFQGRKPLVPTKIEYGGRRLSHAASLGREGPAGQARWRFPSP